MKCNSLMGFLCLAALLAVFAGCKEDKPADLPDLYPTKVTVTKDGQTIDGASVSLSPESGKWSASGMTDASGVAAIKTNGKYEGATPGKYKVSVNKVVTEGEIPQEEADKMSFEELQKAYADRKSESIIPDHLTIPAKSPIEVEVTSDAAANNFTIEINDYPAP